MEKHSKSQGTPRNYYDSVHEGALASWCRMLDVTQEKLADTARRVGMSVDRNAPTNDKFPSSSR